VSDPEGFLTRWSRVKREAAAAAPEPAAAPAPAPVARAAEEPAAPSASDSAGSAQSKDSPSASVDVSALPPIESITAATDIRAFLEAGIPPQLTRAALRRAWVADPAIRDFVGLAENAWDFTDPEAMPGFGPLSPGEAQQAMAKLFAETPPEAAPRQDSDPLQKPDVSAPREPQAQAVAAEEVPPSEPTGEDVSEDVQVDAAVQKEASPEEERREPVRRHGGALPPSIDT